MYAWNRRIYHWAAWAMPLPFELRKISHIARNARLEKLPQQKITLLPQVVIF